MTFFLVSFPSYEVYYSDYCNIMVICKYARIYLNFSWETKLLVICTISEIVNVCSNNGVLIISKMFFFSVNQIITNRGTEMLMSGGFKFSKSYMVGGKTRWQCSTRSRTKCRAYLITFNGEVLKSSLTHSHIN